jgi:hypothetical protein
MNIDGLGPIRLKTGSELADQPVNLSDYSNQSGTSNDSECESKSVNNSCNPCDLNNYPTALVFQNNILRLDRNGLPSLQTTIEVPLPDGSNTAITAGVGIFVSGTGTSLDPYVITNLGGSGGADGNNYPTSLVYNNSTGILTLNRFGLPSLTTLIPLPTGAETKINAGSDITITGTGTFLDPYVINSTVIGADGNNFPTSLSLSEGVLTLSRQGLIDLTTLVNTTNVTEGTNLYYTNTRARLALSAGVGITYNSTTGIITNSSPDQLVTINQGAGINVSGTYPTFSISSSITQYTDTLARLVLSAGSGISYNNSTGVITNSSPDQTVILNSGAGINITGTYPNFTISSNISYDGSETKLSAGTNVSITGTGTIANPYIITSTASGGGGGTVLSLSVVAANGFSGSVANPTINPAITLTTTVTGILKGNAGSLVAAIAGTDYQNPISLTTVGNSGVATFISNVLNIPNYNLVGLGGEPIIASGTTSQYWRGDKTWQNLDTAIRLAISAGTGISYNNTTGVITSSVTQYTDSLARNSVSITTSGTSGAATYNNTTGVFNIPQYSTRFGVLGEDVSATQDRTFALNNNQLYLHRTNASNVQALSLSGTSSYLTNDTSDKSNRFTAFPSSINMASTDATAGYNTSIDQFPAQASVDKILINVLRTATSDRASIRMSTVFGVIISNTQISPSKTSQITVSYDDGIDFIAADGKYKLQGNLPNNVSGTAQMLVIDSVTQMLGYRTIPTNNGTVTSVSVVSANGITGSVSTPSTTPAITLTLGAITPTSVNGIVFSGSSSPALVITGSSSVSGSNTGDNAPNSLYSGLVSNATHTGDATGATALTVVGLRSVLLPTLGASAGNLRYTGTGTNTWIFDNTIYLTTNQNITLSGAVTGSGTTSIFTTLANGIVGIINLSATGTPSSATFLRGDNTWSTVIPNGGTTGQVFTKQSNANGDATWQNLPTPSPQFIGYSGTFYT